MPAILGAPVRKVFVHLFQKVARSRARSPCLKTNKGVALGNGVSFLQSLFSLRLVHAKKKASNTCGERLAAHLRLDLTLCDLFVHFFVFQQRNEPKKTSSRITRSRRVLIDERIRQLKHLKPRECPWNPCFRALLRGAHGTKV